MWDDLNADAFECAAYAVSIPLLRGYPLFGPCSAEWQSQLDAELDALSFYVCPGITYPCPFDESGKLIEGNVIRIAAALYRQIH